MRLSAECNQRSVAEVAMIESFGALYISRISISVASLKALDFILGRGGLGEGVGRGAGSYLVRIGAFGVSIHAILLEVAVSAALVAIL